MCTANVISITNSKLKGSCSNLQPRTFRNTVPSEDLIVADQATFPDFEGRLDGR